MDKTALINSSYSGLSWVDLVLALVLLAIPLGFLVWDYLKNKL